MSKFTFEGDYEMLGDLQKKLVESVLQKRGLKAGKVLVEPVGQKGDNYVAHVKRFIYEATDGATFKMIGKIAPEGEGLRVMMKADRLFNNEIVMYDMVFPKLNDIQNSANITEDEKVRFPICYGVVTEAPFEFILLEDLNESGFQILDRFQPLSIECVRMVLKDLARYHSLSYVLKHSEPETYNNFVDKMFNMWATFEDEPETKRFLKMAENDIVQLMHDSNEKYKKVLNGSWTQMGTVTKKLQTYEKSSKFSVIQQGDCWNNNFLFRLEDGKPVQNVMIDYQLSRESNPASDILYLLFNCTDHALRLKHYQEWIDYYHEILDDSLNNYGLKASRIFPRDQLDAELRRYGKIMVNSAVMLSSMLVREAKDVVDFRDLKGEITENVMEETVAQMGSSNLDTSTVTKLKERIKGIIDTALEFGLISL